MINKYEINEIPYFSPPLFFILYQSPWKSSRVGALPSLSLAVPDNVSPYHVLLTWLGNNLLVTRTQIVSWANVQSCSGDALIWKIKGVFEENTQRYVDGYLNRRSLKTFHTFSEDIITLFGTNLLLYQNRILLQRCRHHLLMTQV